MKDASKPIKAAKYTSFAEASAFSKLTFSWLFPLQSAVINGSLQATDLRLNETEEAEAAAAIVEKEWAAEYQNGSNPKPSLFRVLARCFWVDFVEAGFCKLIWGALVMVCAFVFVRALVAFVSDSSVENRDGWIYSCFFFLACFTLSCALQQMTSKCTRMGVRLRAALLTMLLRKSLRMFDVSQISGEVMNLAANDCQRLLESCTFLHYIWSAPLETVVILALLVVLTGIPALAGIALMIGVVPLQFYLAALTSQSRAQTIKITDSRVQLMNEVLMAIKLVKFYAWEQSFADKVKTIRKAEEAKLRLSALWRSVSLMIVFAVPPMIALVIFSVYTQTEGKLPAVVAFTTLSLFNTLRFPLVVLPRAIRNFAEAAQAVRRIQAFLQLPEFKKAEMGTLPQSDDSKDVCPSKHSSQMAAIEMTNADVGYEIGGEPVLSNVCLDVRPGQLLTITGPVASGKTTLVLTMLGQTHVLGGTASTVGSIGYVPQVPWILHGTVRDNITFGSKFEDEWYDWVVHVCALERDFEILPNGDMTEIGERGASLSGGQRQRIALARAVYQNPDILILDSPLSALDEHTSDFIFRNCIRALLRDKIVVLVTHKLNLLPLSDVVVIMRDRKVCYSGPFVSDIFKVHFPAFANDYATAEDPKEHQASAARHVPLAMDVDDARHGISQEETPSPKLQRKSPFTADDSAQDMHKSVKAVRDYRSRSFLKRDTPLWKVVAMKRLAASRSSVDKASAKHDDQRDDHDLEVTLPRKYASLRAPVLLQWIREAGYGGSFVAIFIAAVTQTCRIMSDTWIRSWTTNQYGREQTFYIAVYAGLVGLFLLLLFCRGYFFFWLFRGTASVMHNRLFAKTLRATMHFFCTTPLGKLLTAFSKDQDTLDESLQDTAHITLVYLMILLTTSILVSTVFPIFAAIVVGVVIVSGFFFVRYLKAARKLKSWISSTNPPIYAHLSESLSGISSIRAFRAQARFEKGFAERIDVHHAACFVQDQNQLWLSFFLDLMGSLLVLSTALLCVGLRSSTDAASAGLAISNAFQWLIFFSMFSKGCAEVDSYLHSVFRLRTFTHNDDQERSDVVPSHRPPTDLWPERGELELKNVIMRYGPKMEPALRGVNLHIKAGEKIGVVGRTGSGKSSIILSIFRLFEPEGEINVDQIPAIPMGLTDLRSHLAIIPQEPVLFKGTVRFNLDPFNKATDAELWSALELSHLKQTISALPLKLESHVAENGSNFSLGHRQMFCLARAILSKSKIVFLDEATAALDLESDALIQESIRTAFADRTVVTIAHRLQTIIGSDRILVMDAGQVKEFDTPANLLDNAGGVFYNLVESTGIAAAGLHAYVRDHRHAGERRAHAAVRPGEVNEESVEKLKRRGSIVLRNSTDESYAAGPEQVAIVVQFSEDTAVSATSAVPATDEPKTDDEEEDRQPTPLTP